MTHARQRSLGPPGGPPCWPARWARVLGLAGALVCLLTAVPTWATNYTVDMQGFQFVPRDLTVNVGDTVTWTNLDQVVHTTTSGTNGIPSGLWDSGFLGPGGSFSFTFNVPAGYYGYYCTPHVFTFNMVGSITVVAPNVPPSVSITNPVSGQVFDAGSNITVDADASDPDDLVSQVEFFVNTNSVAVITNAPFSIVLTNLPVGNYSLGAVATDARGATSAAPAVAISVIQPTLAPAIVVPPASQSVYAGTNVTLMVVASGTPPLSYQWAFEGTNLGTATLAALSLTNVQPSDSGSYTVVVTNSSGSVTSAPAVLTVTLPPNQPPTVSITSPTDSSRIPFGSSLTITADASDSDGDSVQVEFFVGASSVGVVTNPPFSVALGQLPAGDYVLTAQASDSRGGVSNSTPVSVRVYIPEVTPPTITITHGPPTYARLSNPLLSISGTASDDIGLDRVEFQLNGGSFVPASGTNAWTLQTNLVAGNNVLIIRSVDLAGNISRPLGRFFTYVVQVPLSLQVTGTGQVVPNLDSQLLEIGKSYTVKAVPGAGQIFAGWDGMPSAGPTLSFVMQSNLALVANFVLNPFPPVRGGYAGLFTDTNSVAPATSGFLSLRVDNLGTLSGKLAMNGADYPLSGHFDTSGQLSLPVIRHAISPIVLNLQLDLTGASGQITGDTLSAIGPDLFTAEVLAVKGGFSGTNPAPQAGRRPFALLRRSEDGGSTVATGTAQISLGGTVKTEGRFTDGRAFSSSAVLAVDGSSPFYLSLSGGTEIVTGWLEFGTNANGGVSGTLSWVKSATNGFSTELLATPAP